MLRVSPKSIPSVYDILTAWVRDTQPSASLLQELVDGMRNVSFALQESLYSSLQAILSEADSNN